MSKRRISHQQSKRIENIQNQYRKNPAAGLIQDGLIITRFGKHVQVESEDGIKVHCSIRANIDSIVAGDRVVWQKEGEHQGVILSRYPRQSVLGRPDKNGVLKAIAANITQIFIVTAPKPEISWPLLDSYLVMAEALKLNAIIVLNKTDLPCDPIKKNLSTYTELGYSTLCTSNQDEKSYQNFYHLLQGQTSVFVGQSGVGKSSLIASILPHETNISIGEISIASELGKHTTTNSIFYHLPSGGALIDSPGVREMGLWHMSVTEIALGFREFRPYLTQCKYRNCSHKDTPGCGLLEAVKNGNILPQRYENYVKITSQFAK